MRNFAKATGILAKTDAIDARVIAHFAQAVIATSMLFLWTSMPMYNIFFFMVCLLGPWFWL
jgi:hypothetical protein